MTTSLLNSEILLSKPALGDLLPVKRQAPKIWAACETCGKERWTSTLGGRPKYQFCQRCGWSRRHLRTGGRYKSCGYVWVLIHPEDKYYSMANKNGYIAEHRLVMAKHLHRLLEHYEVVHHKNHIRDDNRLENLSLFSGHSEHFADLKLYEYIERLEEENQELRRRLKCPQRF